MLNNNGSNNLLMLFLVLLVLLGCTTSSLISAGATTCSSGSCSSSNDNTNSIFQKHWEQIDNEILELTCQQNRLTDALTVLKVNSTLNNEIITMRSKQLDKLNKAVTLLSQESSYLKASTIPLFKNGTTAWMYKNGTRAKSCSDYRYPTYPYIYSNEGNGLYNIEPISGFHMTIHCQMNMYMDGYSTESIVIDMRLPNGTAAKTCKEYKRFDSTYKNGVYYIKPFNDESEFKVYCDMTNGGYTVFQKRVNGRVDFLRGWQEYSNGFGDEQTSYWLGLRRISKFTQLYQTSLRIDMYHKTNNQYIYAQYSTFSVGTEASDFTLTVGGYSGNAGDSFTGHSGMKFTTIDRDNDTWYGNCAQGFKGAWWHHNCFYSNLNALYLNGQHDIYGNGMEWKDFSEFNYSLEKTSMGMIEAS